ncbi:unnamed protein product [Phytophthora fragariaefolia]|uniref:Unnamed protein product n=1 Tax=Phytophthora fragariaefolia TaxID=1490495 RepID=A0A9W6XAA3_9STRA|nr:unnamed protein product [Phytophthora fragariaefolia]
MFQSLIFIALVMGFPFRHLNILKKDEEALQEIDVKFAIAFWEEHARYPESAIYNVDETAIYFNIPPQKISTIKGSRGSAKVKHIQKNSGRLTAVLTIIADGIPGGIVETDELLTYPPGHVYTVQESGWMDGTVWQTYVMSLLKYEIDDPSVLSLDNHDSHVSEAGQNMVAEETSSIVCPVPANSTSVSQPLDVGVVGHSRKS